jgi:hypothetical protein
VGDDGLDAAVDGLEVVDDKYYVSGWPGEGLDLGIPRGRVATNICKTERYER